jgi:ATP-binding cassette subfamily B protein
MMGRLFEDGREVSIGQWQKLAIARALYSPAKFLIFDEATSALDALSERELFQSFREKIGDKAALIISHRVSAVEHADFIYVLADGRVKESGTHKELIDEGGDYARLFTKKETTDVATKHQ